MRSWIASFTMLIACSSAATACENNGHCKPSPLDPVPPAMERSQPSSGRSATPADINRNGRPTSSESAANLHDVRARPLAFRPDFHQPQNPSHVSTLGQRTSAEIPDRRRTPNLATVPKNTGPAFWPRAAPHCSIDKSRDVKIWPQNETVEINIVEVQSLP